MTKKEKAELKNKAWDLYFNEGKSTSEIADILSISTWKVEKLLGLITE